MNKLSKTRQEYDDSLFDKWKFIDEMYKIHGILFDYSEYLSRTNIASIKISDNQVSIKFKYSGVKFICPKGDKRLAPFDALNFGSYESEEMAMQLKLIGPKDTVVDVGGNLGWYSMTIGKARPESRILVFEPIPSTYHWLLENIKKNKLYNITAHNYGFSDVAGTFGFYYDSTLSVNASLENISNGKNVKNINCYVDTLDKYTKNNDVVIDFIKCDVEGAELLVFKGGTQTIERDKPIVFTEMLRKWTGKFKYHPNDIIAYFDRLGYNCYILRGDFLQYFRKVDEETKETNYFFLHRVKHKSQIKLLVK